MKIVEIRELKRKRIKVIFDNDAAYLLNQLMLMEAFLYVGKEMTEEEAEALIDVSCKKDAFGIALNYVGYQARTVKEVDRRLQKEEYDQELIKEVLNRMIEEKYLNDETYAVEYYQQNRERYGIRRIRYKLNEKGIGEMILDKIHMEDDLMSAIRLTEKKYGEKLGLLDYTLKGKLSSYLSGRGYMFDTIKRVVSYFEEKI
jgi:regulatory protein